MNFKLELLNWIKFHSIFYIEKLESADPEISIQIKKLLKFLQYNKYKIKRIKNYNLEICQYIVKQKKYPREKNI